MKKKSLKGSVFRRRKRDGTPYDKWSIRYDTYVSGKRRPIELTNKFNTEAEATAALAAVHVEIENESHLLPSKAILGDYAEAWLRSRKSELRPSAYKAYEGYIEHIKKHLGHLRVQVVQAKHIRQLMTTLAEPGMRLDGRQGSLSAQTRRHIYSMLRQMFAAATSDGDIRVNPVLAVPRPKENKKEFEVWNENEAKQFLNVARSHELYAAFALDLAVGMRRGELLGLEWGGLASRTDEETGTLINEIVIRKAHIVVGYKVVAEKPKTKSGIRTIEIDARVLAILNAHKARQGEARLAAGLGKPGPHDPVFHDPDKVTEFIHPEKVNTIFERLVAESGVKKIRFHDLRHTCASIALRNGADILAVSRMLGHKSPSFTLNVYSHLLPGQQREAAIKVSDAILG